MTNVANLTRITKISLSALLLTACTGGALDNGSGGGGSVEMGPLIVSVSPSTATERTGLSRIDVAFNKALDPDSVTPMMAVPYTVLGSCVATVSSAAAVGHIARFTISRSGCADGDMVSFTFRPNYVRDLNGNSGWGPNGGAIYTLRNGTITLAKKSIATSSVFSPPTSFKLEMTDDVLSIGASAIVKTGTCASTYTLGSPVISGSEVSYSLSLTPACANGTTLSLALNPTQVRNLSNVAGTGGNIPLATFTIDNTPAQIVNVFVDANPTAPGSTILTSSPQLVSIQLNKPINPNTARGMNMVVLSGSCVTSGRLASRPQDVGFSPDNLFVTAVLQPNGGCRSGDNLTITVRPDNATSGDTSDDLYDANGGRVTVAPSPSTYTFQ